MASRAFPAWEFSLFVLGLLIGRSLPVFDHLTISLFVVGALYVLARTEDRVVDIRQLQLDRLERCESRLAVLAAAQRAL
jgi:hypothetical protein